MKQDKHDSTLPPAPQRFLLVDALRGLAALAIVVRHSLNTFPVGLQVKTIMPANIEAIITFGFLKVTIFFVLSGFVITHSLRKVSPTAASLGNFILRRQIRLDLPYWIMLFLTLIALYFPPSGVRYYDLPSWRAVLVNLVYLQNILHAWNILGVAWTLCLQVQFYLFFVLTIGMQGFLSRNNIDIKKCWQRSSWILLLTGIIFPTLLTNDHNGWFLFWWPYFALGCLSYLAIQKLTAPWMLIILGMSMVGNHIVSLIFESDIPVTFSDGYRQMLAFFWGGPFIALLLLEAGRREKLEHWGNHKILLFLGRISYSLYLSHLLVLRTFYDLFDTSQKSPLLLCTIWLTGLGIALSFAYAMYCFVEKPSMVIAQRVKTKQDSQFS